MTFVLSQLLACSSDKAEQKRDPTLGKAAIPALAADLDNDRSVTVVDLQLLVNVLLGTETTPLTVARADFDGSGSADVGDLQQLVNLLLGCGGTNNDCTCTVGANPTVSDQSQLIGGEARFTTATEMADIDNDGDLDIVWVSQFNGGTPPLGGIDITENLGNGSFSTTNIGDENSTGGVVFRQGRRRDGRWLR